MTTIRSGPLVLALALAALVAIALPTHAEGDRQGLPDPLLFSTFVGGDDSDWPHSVVVAANGTVYVAGYTLSYDFPTTDGAYQRVTRGDEEVFVLCLSPDGSELRWATLVGGSGEDIAWDLALGTDGRVYVTGLTRSSDFPTTKDAHSRTRDGASDAFVLCLAPDGGSLVYSTLLGGENEDHGYSIQVMPDGRAIVAGHTESVFFPSTYGAHDTGLDGASDAFLARLSADGRTLQAATYLGGSYTEWEPAITLDGEGNVWVTGSTTSQDFPTTAGLPNGWNFGRDVFVASLDKELASVRLATVIGQEGNDVPRSIDLGEGGEVLVGGFTTSFEFPDTGNRPGNDNNGLTDGFVLVLSDDMTTTEHAWLYGGSNFDVVRTALLDGKGMLHLVGYTNSTNFPTTLGSYQPYKSGDDHDMFYVQVDARAGYQTVNGTYVGRNMGDFGMDMDLNEWGVPVVAGHTRSDTFPTDGTPFDHTHNGAGDVFVLMYTTDEEGPVFSNDTTPGRVETGENVTFSVEVTDQTGLHEVWLIYTVQAHDHERDVWVLLDTDVTRTSVIIGTTSPTLTYRFLAWDVLGHSSETDVRTITVVDTIFPELVSDMTPEEGTTGDPFDLRFQALDNWRVDGAAVEYEIGDREANLSMTSSFPDHGYSTWNRTIELARSSLAPVRYRFHLWDEAGNAVTTDWRQVPVRDDDPPVLGEMDLPDLSPPGGYIALNVTVSDNIEVIRVWVEHFVEVGKVEVIELDAPYGNRVQAEVPVPSGRGSLHVSLHAEDEAANNASVSGLVPFYDDDPPEMLFVYDATATTGDVFKVTWTASDPAGIHSMWGLYAFAPGPGIDDYIMFLAEEPPVGGVDIQVPADSTDALYVILAAQDAYGNQNQTEPIVIEVVDDDPPTADAGAYQEIVLGELVTLDASASTDNIGVTNYKWEWTVPGERTWETETTTEPWLELNLTVTGIYDFRLEVTDQAGNSDTDTVEVKARKRPPQEEVCGTDYLVTGIIVGVIVAIIAVTAFLYLRSRR